MYITDDIKYIGVNDHQIDLFEGQYRVPAGMAYNSYLIVDEKTAVMDSVDVHFTQQWLDNIKQALEGEALTTLWYSIWNLTTHQALQSLQRLIQKLR